jgi:hypothetical protein
MHLDLGEVLVDPHSLAYYRGVALGMPIFSSVGTCGQTQKTVLSAAHKGYFLIHYDD